MKINPVNNAILQSAIDSIYRVSDNNTRNNKVNLKEAPKDSIIEGLSSKDGFSQDIRYIDLEDRLYRGTKSFKNVLTSALMSDLEFPDDVYAYLENPENAPKSDKNSAGTGYFISMQDNAIEDPIENLYNEISYLYDPSLRFDTGRLVNILV